MELHPLKHKEIENKEGGGELLHSADEKSAVYDDEHSSKFCNFKCKPSLVSLV